ncbi:MAG: J domain-containing protein [Candidatus Omnitrophica bacterium]|nr:J domain-containing protein [Candidatus Omnitrophota bacterium]
MSDVTFQCPYCAVALIPPEESLERRQVSIRCKYCYGIFSFKPYDKRITFNKTRNYYEIFGLENNVDTGIIKKRYRELALRFHPDRQIEKELASERMKQINYIYSVLSNPDSRSAYDATVGVNAVFEDLYSNFEPPFYFYQESIEIVDAWGLKSEIKRGDYIYYLASQTFSIFGKRFHLRRKGYLGMKVQKIFNPESRAEYEKALGRKMEKEPLFCMNFGNEEMVIYKEDFQQGWISQKSLDKKDLKTVVVSVVVILLLISSGLFYLYKTYTVVIDDDGHEHVVRQQDE